MAPARHETAGAPDQQLQLQLQPHQPQPPPPPEDDKMPYGTRNSSKRKAAEMSSAHAVSSPSSPSSSPSSPSSPLPPPSPPAPSQSSSAPKTATRSHRSKASSEPQQRPAKKRRSSPVPPPDEPAAPSARKLAVVNGHRRHASHGSEALADPAPAGASAKPGPDAESSSRAVPEVQGDRPRLSSADAPRSPAPDDDDVPEPELPNGLAVAGPGRGRGRGRGGFRGRAARGRGSRGGRVSKAASTGRGGKPATPSARGRGPGRGRGGRRKKPEDPVIDVVHHRKTELKAHYKAIAALHRDGLIALSEKSLELTMADPAYHESLPEFEKVCKGLQEQFDQQQVANDTEREHKAGLANRTLDYNAYVVEQQFRLRMEDLQEQYEARIMEEVNYIYYKQTKNQRDLDEIPFANGEDGRIVKQSAPPPKRVHATGNPFMDPGRAVSNARSTRGDNDSEQHPANWWEAKSKKEKSAILRKQAEYVAERERLHRRDGRKKGGRQALFQPDAQHETAEGEEAVAEPDEGADEQAEEDGAQPAESPAPATVPGSPEGDEPENHVTEDADSDARPQETDEFGVSIPHKKVRRDQPAPYNRIQADAPVQFEPHEIGLRQTHYQKLPDGTHKKLGRDVDPNPKSGKFFYEQRQGRYNAGKNQSEDLDQEIVATHKLHPRLGLPIAGSDNPSHDECTEPYFPEPTDWTKPWENSNPVMFIHTALDGTRSVSRTSRSEWMYRAQRAFEQIPLAQKMGDLLDQANDREARAATPVAPPSPGIIDAELVQAVNEAADQQAAESLRAAEGEGLARAHPLPPPSVAPAPPAPPAPPAAAYVESSRTVYSPPRAYNPPQMAFSPPQPVLMGPPPAPPQRSTGYDPVRDRTYLTPYASQPVRPAAPPAHAMYINGGNLSELANAADFWGTRPPPPLHAFPTPTSPYASAPMSAPQTQRLPGYPADAASGFSQYQVSPYGPPPPPSSRGGPGPGPGSVRGGRAPARELRPAPPGMQQPPPPPPFRAWGGYGQ